MSRNAFRNNEFTKSFELMEDFEDEDYFFDAPIIKIKFKRDVNNHFELEHSFLIQKLIWSVYNVMQLRTVINIKKILLFIK